MKWSMIEMRKYRNKKVKQDGYTFDSIAEHHRYLVLCDMEARGEIEQLEVHPKFTLQESFVDTWSGKRQRAVTYTGDFRYLENAHHVVEDVKGGRATQTAAFRIKAKWFMRLNPGIEFRVVEM